MRFLKDKKSERIEQRPLTCFAIMDFLDKYNENPKIFTWTKDADTILAKGAKRKEALGTGH